MFLNKKIISGILLSALLSTSVVNTSYAITSSRCNPTIKGQIDKATKEKQEKVSEDISKIDEKFEDYVNEMIRQTGCIDSFMTGISISLPTIDEIIRKAKDKIVSEACRLAREKIREVTKNIPTSVSTGNIPGLSDIGINGPSASGTTGGGVTINGSSTSSVGGVWDNIKKSL